MPRRCCASRCWLRGPATTCRRTGRWASASPPPRQQHATPTCPADVPCALLVLPQALDVLWTRGGPSRSGQTPRTPRPPPSPGRPRRAGAQEGVARRDERVRLRAAGVPGTVGGDDAAARNKLAYLPWRVGPARPLARASGRVRARGARARTHGLDGPPVAGPDGTGVKTASSRAWSWAALMHRAFAIDALACTHCGGRLRLIATLHDPAVIRKILAHLGLCHSGQRPGPAPPESGAAAS
jgi:hypothetical protein